MTLKEQFLDYIEEKPINAVRLFSTHLLDEFMGYSEKAALKSKASRVYYKCLRKGKRELAGKIAMKYHLYLRDDRIVAFALALQK